MLKQKLLLTFFIFMNVAASQAQKTPLSTEEIMKEAFSTAAKENKKVFIMFHASWCGWCHKMDASMNDVVCKKYFDDNFVIRHLVVFESKGKENLENPGSLEMLTKYNGADQGIPFWLVFDKNENFLADSRMAPPSATPEAKSMNTGCPANKEEVDYFIGVLKKSTSLKETELEIIRERFRKNSGN
jgi:thiol-disulfide isomerase/thioredoxin